MAGIFRNVFTVGAFTALSRVLGLGREMLQSRLIGAGVEQSAFTLAFALPNMMRKLFGEGALTAAFVPVFKAEVACEGVEKAARLARAVMTSVFLALAAILALAFGALGLWVRIAELGPRGEIAATLIATLLPYMLFICGAAFGMGVLNALGRFKASSFMPALLNILWIAALAMLLFFPSLTPRERVEAVAWAILAAGAVQMVFMFVCMARAGVVPRMQWRFWQCEKVRLVWRNLAVAALGSGAIQVNYALDQVLAQVASPWAAGVIGYAERLMDLPLGVVGVAFGTVLLPAAAGLCVLASETTAVVYEGGGFDATATLRVSRSLAVYALGLGFFGLQKTLVPWFHAQNDMKTPLRVSVSTVVLNAVLNILAVAFLTVEWRHVGLAVSTVVCAGVGCALLFSAARRRNGRLGLAAAVKPLAAIGVSALAMAALLFALRPLTAAWPRPLALAALVAAGAAAYGLSVCALLRGEVRRLAGRVML